MSGLGTQFTIKVGMEPMDGFHMADLPFKARFYVYTNRYVEIDKSEMIKVDADNYLALVDSSKVGAGQIVYRLYVDVPDANWEKEYRHNVSDEIVCEGCVTK